MGQSCILSTVDMDARVTWLTRSFTACVLEFFIKNSGQSFLFFCAN